MPYRALGHRLLRIVAVGMPLTFTATLCTAQAKDDLALDIQRTEQALQASTPVPVAPYRNVFSSLSLGVEETLLDWKAANATVGQFERGHIDLLQWEKKTTPAAPNLERP